MLEIEIPSCEYFDERKMEFVVIKGHRIKLEHSLLSLSKWESKWHKPFLGPDKKTDQQMIDYIRCMTITQNVDPIIYQAIPESEIDKINDYISDPMTATWFSEQQGGPNREIVTAELIYYWMIALSIPFECQKWHLNRLLTLIQVCNIKNAPPKTLGRNETYRRNRELNAARRNKIHSSG